MKIPRTGRKIRERKLGDKFAKVDQSPFFRVGHAAYTYYRTADDHKPEKREYREWLEALPKLIRKGMEVIGFEGCKEIISFRRYSMRRITMGWILGCGQILTRKITLIIRESSPLI